MDGSYELEVDDIQEHSLKNHQFEPNTHVIVGVQASDDKYPFIKGANNSHQPLEVLVNWDGQYEFNGWTFDKDDHDSEIMGPTDLDEPTFIVDYENTLKTGLGDAKKRPFIMKNLERRESVQNSVSG